MKKTIFQANFGHFSRGHRRYVVHRVKGLRVDQGGGLRVLLGGRSEEGGLARRQEPRTLPHLVKGFAVLQAVYQVRETPTAIKRERKVREGGRVGGLERTLDALRSSRTTEGLASPK